MEGDKMEDDERGISIREDDFVYQIVKDPAAPPDTLLVIGFVGKSSLENHTRIYLDVLLGSFVDLPNSAILHAREVPLSQSPLGGWYIWVRRDLSLLDTVRAAYTKLNQIQQDYMQDIQPDGDGFREIQPGWPEMPT